MAEETDRTEGAPNVGATGDFPPTEGTAAGEAPGFAPVAEDSFAQRPELFVAAAFAGGFALARILRRLGS